MEQQLPESGWLAQTRFGIPCPRDDVISRSNLIAALQEALVTYPLILVSAPAGYGKIALLATLSHAFPDPPLAWLTLDEEDNDPTRFLVVLIAALGHLKPACGVTTQTVLASLTNPAAQTRQVIGVLVNDILETLPVPFALILDDLHLITEPAVFAALDHLAVLHERTEGWPVGLRLLGNSLNFISAATDRTACIQGLVQTDRYVFDFLADEALNRQPADVRAFLLETSILSELTPDLCRAVTGREDAGLILENLHRRNLFVTADRRPPTDDHRLSFAVSGPPSYRYHALFAEFLRQRLTQEMPTRVRDLHRQADPLRAIKHYFAAEMWEAAVGVIEQVGFVLLQQGLLDTISGWTRVEPRPVLMPGTGETLTPREVEVLRLLAARASNRQIAEQPVVTEHTVKSHVSHILRKLNVSSRAQAVASARELL